MTTLEPPYESRGKVYEAIRTIISGGRVPYQQGGSAGYGRTLKAALGFDSSSSTQTNTPYGNIKARTSSSYVSLFSKEPPEEHRVLWNEELQRQFGSRSDGEWVMWSTIKTSPNSKGMLLDVTGDAVVVKNEDYGEVARYPHDFIRPVFEQRLPGLFLVEADKDDEGLDFQHAEHFYDMVSYETIKQLFRDDILKIGYRNGSDYGTGFRVRPRDVGELFHGYNEIA